MPTATGTAFVDGGVNSPYAATSGVADPSGPYYQTPEEQAAQVSFDPATGNGTITVTDAPSAIYFYKTVQFTTTIVATNYYGTGLDMPITTYTWGWTDYGQTPLPTVVNTTTTSAPQGQTKIIQYDYPKYQFYQYTTPPLR